MASGTGSSDGKTRREAHRALAPPEVIGGQDPSLATALSTGQQSLAQMSGECSRRRSRKRADLINPWHTSWELAKSLCGLHPRIGHLDGDPAEVAVRLEGRYRGTRAERLKLLSHCCLNCCFSMTRVYSTVVSLIQDAVNSPSDELAACSTTRREARFYC
jgi:hypothetical protein